MGIVPDGTGAGGRAAAGRQRPVSARRVRARRPRRRCRRSLIPTAARPRNAGLIFKVVPDETMRGLELRKGTVDLVVNDLSPDLVHGLRRGPATRGQHGAGHRLRVHRVQPARSAAAGSPRPPRHWLCRSITDAIVQLPAPRPRATGDRHRAVDVLGVRAPTRCRFAHDPERARARCSTKPATAIRTAPVRRPACGSR